MMDASQSTCPKCGWAREPNAVDCPACGIVYARYTGAPQRREPAPAPAPAPSAPAPSGEALNPYAPPQSLVQALAPAPADQPSGAGVWRTADLLVMQKGVHLPSRCLVCNGPAAVHYPKKMYWHHPGLYLLLFLGGPLIYAIGAVIARKKADMVLPLCAGHAEKRKKASTWGALLMVLGIALLCGSCTQLEGDGTALALMFWPGILLFFGGGIWIISGAYMIVPKKIDDYYVWLSKVSGSYLSALPPAPPGL